LVNKAALKQAISCGDLCGKISKYNMKPTDLALEKVHGEISELEDRLERGMLKDELFCNFKWHFHDFLHGELQIHDGFLDGF